MLAYMKYENGLKFQKIIFENENAAKIWLKQNGISNPNCYELIEIEFIKEDLKALRKIELKERLQRAKEKMAWAHRLCNQYKEDDEIITMANKLAVEYEEIQQEYDNL